MRPLRRPWEEESYPERLGVADRCDACGARATAHVTVGHDGHLLLCGYHFRTHERAVVARGYAVDDTRPPAPALADAA